MIAALHPEELQGRRPVWLLTLECAGQVWRLASETIEVTDDDGEVYGFEGVLDDIEVEQALGDLGASPEEPVVSFSGLWLDGVLGLIADGHDPSAGRGELAVWLEGTTFEQRRVLVSGRLQHATVYVGDYVDLTLGDTLGDDDGRILPATAVVDSTTWPSAAADAVGGVYPLVFGQPGVFLSKAGASKTAPATPALMVDTTSSNEVLLVSWGACGASSVRVFNLDDGSAANLSTSTTTDGLGQIVTVVDLSSPGTLTVDEDATYAIAWNDGAGLVDEYGDAITGAGSIILWMLRYSSLRIDRPAWEGVRDRLDDYVLAFYIDDTGFSPVDWLGDNLLPILPMSLTLGAAGLAPIVWPIGLRAEHVEAELDLTELPGDFELEEGEGLRFEGDYLAELRIHYAAAIDGEAYRRTQTWTGDPQATPSAAVALTQPLSSAWLAQVERGGTAAPGVLDIETDVVADDVTAARILGGRMELEAEPKQVLGFRASWNMAWLYQGQPVALTVDGLELSNRLGVVSGIRWGLSGPRYTIDCRRSGPRDLNGPA